MQDYLYSALSFVAIAIHLIINYDVLFAGNSAIAKSQAHYRGFLLAVLGYYVTDVAWGILAGLGWTLALYYETILYFLALALVVLEWCRFVVAYLDLRGKAGKLLVVLGYALVAFNIVMLTVNFFNDCFFWFDEQGRYVVGSQRNLAFIFQLFLNILAAAFAFIKALGSQGTLRRRTMLVVLLGATMTIAFGVQIVWPLLPFTALGCALGNCFFHVFVIEDERDELRKAIIERNQAERHMQKLKEALERARAAEKARSMFFSIVSHDIRTPLNAILGYSELLQYEINDKTEHDEALKAIRASGTALLQLVNDVLDLAKMDAGKLSLTRSPVHLAQLTDDVLLAFRLMATGKGISLTNLTADVPTLMLDEHRLRQILFNLIGNAVKFTAHGGVTVTATYDGASLTMSVADTGRGIPQDMLKRILEPFVQAHDPTHPATHTAAGTGLGLPICKRLVEVMGGTLHVESELGKGATFTFVIPCARTATVAEAAASHPSATTDTAAASENLPQHVLVVDDSPVNRTVLKAFLKKAGIDAIDFAGDGEEALSVLRTAAEAGKPHDLVFSDFWMPKMNGLELIEKLRAESRFAHLKVFAVTADTEIKSGNDKRTKLFSGILFKPFTYDKLLAVLKRLAC